MMLKLSGNLLKIVTLLLCLLAILLGTSLGAKIIVAAVNQLELLELDHRSGSILHQPSFSKVIVKLDTLHIEVDEVALDLSLPCLLKTELCFDYITGKKFNLTLDSSTVAEKEEVPVSENPFINIPLILDLNNVSFDLVNVRINDLRIEVESFSSDAYLANELIELDLTDAEKVAIYLADAKPPSPQKEVVQPKKATTPTSATDWPLAQLPTISIPLDLKIKQLAVRALLLEIHKEQHHISDIDLEAQWRLDKVKIANLQASVNKYSDAKITGNVKLNGNAALTAPYPLLLEINTDLNRLDLLPEVNKSKQEIIIDGDFSDLNISANSTGSLVLQSSISLNAESPKLPYQLDINIDQMTLPNQLRQEFDATRLSLQSKGDLKKHQVNLTTNITGFGFNQADITLDAIVTDTKSSIKQLTFSEQKTASKASAQGSISYSDEVSWMITLQSPGFTVPKLAQVEGRLKGELTSSGSYSAAQTSKTLNKKPSKLKGNSAQWQVAITNTDISGQLNQIDFSLLGDFEINHHLRIAPSDLTLNAFNSTLEVSGYSDENWYINGQLNSDNLSDILPELSGSSELTFSVKQSFDNPLINLQAHSKHLAYNKLSVEQLSAKLSYQPLQHHQGNLKLTSSSLKIQENEFTDIDIKLNGNINKQSLAVEWLGDLHGKIFTTSEFNQNDQRLNIQLKNSLLAFKDFNWRNNKNVDIELALKKNQVKISPHCWNSQASELCLNNAASIGETGKIDLSALVDISKVSPFLLPEGLKIDTQLSSAITAQWQKNSLPTIKANANLSKGSISFDRNKSPQELLAWQQGLLAIELQDQQLQAIFNLSDTKGDRLINLEQNLALNDDKKLQGMLTINRLSLASIKAWLPDIDNITADLSSQLSIQGNLQHPEILGEISIGESNISFNRTSDQIKELSLITKIEKNHARITSQFLLNEDPAQLTAKIDWQDKLRVTTSLKADRLLVTLPPKSNIEFSPDISAVFSDNLLSITGKVDLISGLVQIDQLPAGSVNESEDTIIVDINNQPLTKKSILNVESHIDIAIAKAFKLNGYGFTGNLAGDIAIRQEQQQPLKLFGTLKVLNGFYKAYGQHLDVKRGNINFNGSATTPYVDFQAGRHIKKDDVDVGINLTGTTNSLSLELYSQPTMEQPEILSYLIKGSGLSSESGGSAAAIGLALSTTLSKASNLNDFVENLPFLTDVSLGTEVEGDQAQATISGYVGERIYLKYGVGLYEPVNEVTVRLYLLNQLWLETVSGLDKSADIYYSFDIE